VFELSRKPQALVLSLGPDDGDASHAFEIFEEALDAVWVSDGFSSAEMEKPGEEISEDTGEDVDVEFLIGPVELGTKGDVEGVLEVCEDGFDGRLTPVSADDFGD